MSLRKSKRIRWWPLALIVAVAGGIVAVTSQPDSLTHQQKYMRMGMTIAAALALFLVWTLFLSRMKWALRLGITGGVLALIGLAAATLKVEGVTGDLLPIVTWKWSQLASERVGDLVEASSGALASDSTSRALPEHFSDYPQFLGPDRTAIVDGPLFEIDWETHPPRELWRQPIGPAWSGFAVKGFRAITQEQRGDEERVTCYDLLSGALLWAHGDSAHYSTVLGGEGPRATPSIDDRRVYTLGATGILNCLALETGKRIWQRNIQEDAAAKGLDWGYAGSPLVAGNLVIVNAGGTENTAMIAYRKTDGEMLWSNGSDPASYSTPVLATLAGVEQVLIFHQRGIASHDSQTGDVLWSFPVKHNRPHVAVPLIIDTNRVMISSGYGYGSVMLQVRATEAGDFTVEQEWKSIRLQSKFNNLIQKDGFVYGLHDGTFCCLDPATGKRLWKEGHFGHGQMILANETQLLLTTESGGVKLIEPSPEKLRVLCQMHVFDEKMWNSPALAGDFLLLRNHKEAVCYRLVVVARSE